MFHASTVIKWDGCPYILQINNSLTAAQLWVSYMISAADIPVISRLLKRCIYWQVTCNPEPRPNNIFLGHRRETR